MPGRKCNSLFDKICKVGLCSVSLSTKVSWPEKGSKTPD